MKKNIKIALSFILIIICSSILGCSKKEKSNVDILKDYSLLDENTYEITSPNNLDSIDIDATSGDSTYQADRRYVHKKNDNRVQYIVEEIVKTEDNYVKVIHTYAIEFRDDGIYSTEKKRNCGSIEAVPDLISESDSSTFNYAVLKMPLEVGTSWQNEGIDGTYKIDAVDEDKIEVSFYLNDSNNTKRETDIFKKGVGSSDYTLYWPNGSVSKIESITRPIK